MDSCNGSMEVSGWYRVEVADGGTCFELGRCNLAKELAIMPTMDPS